MLDDRMGGSIGDRDSVQVDEGTASLVLERKGEASEAGLGVGRSDSELGGRR